MTYEELERLYYITNDPQLKYVQALVDMEDQIGDLYCENNKLNIRLSVLEDGSN